MLFKSHTILLAIKIPNHGLTFLTSKMERVTATAVERGLKLIEKLNIVIEIIKMYLKFNLEYQQF